MDDRTAKNAQLEGGGAVARGRARSGSVSGSVSPPVRAAGAAASEVVYVPTTRVDAAAAGTAAVVAACSVCGVRVHCGCYGLTAVRRGALAAAAAAAASAASGGGDTDASGGASGQPSAVRRRGRTLNVGSGAGSPPPEAAGKPPSRSPPSRSPPSRGRAAAAPGVSGRGAAESPPAAPAAEKKWMCDGCRYSSSSAAGAHGGRHACALCTWRGGAMRPVADVGAAASGGPFAGAVGAAAAAAACGPDGAWVHIACALWVPEVCGGGGARCPRGVVCECVRRSV